MYRIFMVVALLALSAMPTWARGATGQGTMHRLGSNLRHRHVTQSAETPAPSHEPASPATN
jgi:hypothetical protein